eukprot:m.117409 g.117409  ORF g.117409 m.117409 type:complete len:445 (+) comp14250_c0_seq5:35-1369(+)
MSSSVATYDDVVQAARRMRGRLHKTQVAESLALNNLCGARVLVKCEALQRTGTFKFRGALNRILRLSAAEREAGVVAFSSGNFGQGLAAAAQAEHVQCIIVMPGDAPENKQARARSYGATVVLSDILRNENREITAARLAEKISREHNMTLVHPFEDRDVVAGQGTCAMELIDYCEENGIQDLDSFFVCIGGGGLSSGCCLALANRMSGCKRYIVEPELYNDTAMSLSAGKRCHVVGNPKSICDALQAAAPGVNTFPILKEYVTKALTVTDEEVRYAMRIAFETLQLVLEPSGAVPLAAVLASKIPVAGKTIAVVASGGNIDLVKFAKILGCPSISEEGLNKTATTGNFDWTGFSFTSDSKLSRPLLAIHCHGGMLGCKYFDISTFDAANDVAALVSGVSCPEDMLEAKIVSVSKAAISMGIVVGMKGREALRLMKDCRTNSKL